MPAELPRDMGGGLLLRQATPDDTEALAEFNAPIHAPEGGATASAEAIRLWTRDLMSGTHPTFRPGDFTLVEDLSSGNIVSCQCLIAQTWAYRGIEFSVGRIELVGTAPAYRRRGLVAAQMDVAHRWSSERGLAVQAITGIPHYYRRFGYEMALELAGGRAGSSARVPALEDGADEPFTVRPATEADVPFLVECAAPGRDRWLVADAWNEDTLGFVATRRAPGSDPYAVVGVIEDAHSVAVGFVVQRGTIDRGMVRVVAYELADGARWPEVTPSVLRYVKTSGTERAAAQGAEVSEIVFGVGTSHPVHDVATRFLSRTWQPYGWYLRVEDLAGFIRHISPALEWRLADTAYAGHSGSIKIYAGDRGLEIELSAGLIEAVKPWHPDSFDDGDVVFPELSFLQALFGLRSLSSLEDVFADCVAFSDVGHGLTEALFPAEPSNVVGLE